MSVLRPLGFLLLFAVAVSAGLFVVEWLRTLGPYVGFAVMGTLYALAFLSARGSR